MEHSRIGRPALRRPRVENSGKSRRGFFTEQSQTSPLIYIFIDDPELSAVGQSRKSYSVKPLLCLRPLFRALHYLFFTYFPEQLYEEGTAFFQKN